MEKCGGANQHARLDGCTTQPIYPCVYPCVFMRMLARSKKQRGICSARGASVPVCGAGGVHGFVVLIVDLASHLRERVPVHASSQIRVPAPSAKPRGLSLFTDTMDTCLSRPIQVAPGMSASLAPHERHHGVRSTSSQLHAKGAPQQKDTRLRTCACHP